jgi:hypothetical protein
MRQVRIFATISLLLLVLSACGSPTPAQQIPTEVPTMVATEVPTVMLDTPTAVMPVETATTEAMPTVESTATTSGSIPVTGSGLGVKLDDVKSVMQATQQFEFSDGDVDGKPASIAKLTSTAASTFPTLATGFSAAFIGDPANLSEIKITLPRSADQPDVEESVKVITLIIAGILPANVQSQFTTWMNQNFSDIPVDSSKETTIENFKFTVSRTATDMVLDVVSAQ